MFQDDGLATINLLQNVNDSLVSLGCFELDCVQGITRVVVHHIALVKGVLCMCQFDLYSQVPKLAGLQADDEIKLKTVFEPELPGGYPRHLEFYG